MERYLIYKIGLAILFYAMYFRKCAAVDSDPNDLIFYQGVHGKPGVDFPTLSNIPRTTFSCKEVDSGYYADLETDCQVFHICNEGTKISFLCPNGTIFQQSDLICDWWFKVNCTSSPELYEESAEHLREEIIKKKASRRVVGDNNRRMSFNSEENKQRSANSNQKNSGAHFSRAPIKDVRNKITSEETQVPQETASFVRDTYFNKNNIRHSQKYPNHRTTYSDLKDPNYFSKNSLDVSSTTSSSIKPEIVVNQKAPINNGKPFTATTVEGIYDSNSGFQKGLKAKVSESSTQKSRGSSKSFSSNSLGGQTKKQTTIYVNTHKSSSYNQPSSHKTTASYGNREERKRDESKAFKATTKPYSTKSSTNRYITSTTQSPIIRIALNNKQNVLRNITASARNSKESKVVNIVTLPTTTSPKVGYTNLPTTNKYEGSTNRDTARKGKAFNNNFNSNSVSSVTPNLRPKPFESLIPSSPSTAFSDKFYYTTTNGASKFGSSFGTTVPKYKVSSPSPFASSPTQSTTLAPPLSTSKSTFTSTAPTQPTVSDDTYPKSYENVNNMITTLMDLTNDRQDKENAFGYQRPDLIIPPSVGPQTLHTLAVYFANALDSIAPANSGSTDNIPTERYDESDEISLLSQSTVNKYNDLFKQRQEEIEQAMLQMLNDQENSSGDEDLITENSKHAFDSPNVRQLAKVFTEALSAYLDDPVGFKKDLEKVRPTDPPFNNDPYLGEDDEVLNFSDADIANTNKEHFPTFTTPATTTTHQTATWGYILALNHSDVEENSINPAENLQQSNSQYYVPHSSNLLRRPKVDSAFSVSSNSNGVEYEHKPTTSSLVSLFNTQGPSERPATADRFQSHSTPSAYTNYPSLVQNTQTPSSYTNPTPIEIQQNIYSNLNGFYNATTHQHKTSTFNPVTHTTPTSYKFDQTQTTFNLPSTYTTPEPTYQTSTPDFSTSGFKGTTESAVAKLFNYFENRGTLPNARNVYNPPPRPSFNLPSTDRANTYTTPSTPVRYTSPAGTTYNNVQGTSSSFTTFQTNPPTTATIPPSIESVAEKQQSIYSDITRLNNLANVATSEPYSSNTQSDFGSSFTGPRFGKFINDFNPSTSTSTQIPTVTPATFSTYVPHNHKEHYSTLSQSNKATTQFDAGHTSFVTTPPAQPLPLTNFDDTPTKSTHVNNYDHIQRNAQSAKDVEARFASLVNKATTILSNLHNVQIQPQSFQSIQSTTYDIESPNEEDRGTAASLTGNTANLPNNHWTTSSDVAKLWQTTLYVNAESLNQKLNATEETVPKTTAKPLHEQIYDDVSFEASVPSYAEIEYDLQALPKLELNSTQVHGVLIDFINATMKSEHKLEKFLKKLNTTEDEFLRKMKEIEKNPLTRRLILLLISECNKDHSKESSRQPKVLFPAETTASPPGENFKNIDFVQLPLGNEDQDARALDLLNSLYSIASKYGK